MCDIIDGFLRRGWHLLPIVKGDKRPANKNGVKETTQDLATVAGWLEEGKGIGIVAGPSGLVILDVDPKHGGDVALEDLEMQFGVLPDSFRVRTPSSGQHIYFKAPEGVSLNNSTGLLPPGLDVRGNGGYVVTSPTNGYEIVIDGEVEDLPAWLLEKIKPRKPQEVKCENSVRQAADKWRADHPIDWDSIKSRACPACGHKGCFQPSAKGPNWWSCFSASHAADSGGVGHQADDYWYGDALDLESAARKLSVRQVLEDDGYLSREALFASKSPVPIAKFILEQLDSGMRPIKIIGGEVWRYHDKLGIWKPFGWEHIECEIEKLDGQPYGEKGVIIAHNAFIQDVRKSIDRNNVNDEWFADAPNGVAFADCFVQVNIDGDLTTSPLDPKHKSRSCIEFPYTTEPSCPRWLKFLGEVFEGDEDCEQKIALLQEFAGICLLGQATEFQKILVLYGAGSNGKSVVTDVLTSLFPRDATAAVPPQRWGNEYYIAKMQGIRFNCMADIPEGDIMRGDTIKAIVAGDPVEARHPAGRPFTIHPIAGHLFSANTLPHSKDNSKGYWRRFMVITFNQTFVGKQSTRQFTAPLLEERAGIIRWALEGAQRLIRTGEYTALPSSIESTEEWRGESDKVLCFLNACCAKGEPDLVQSSILYKAFCDYAQAAHIGVVSMSKFGRRLKELGLEKVHKNTGNHWAISLKRREEWLDVPAPD